MSTSTSLAAPLCRVVHWSRLCRVYNFMNYTLLQAHCLYYEAINKDGQCKLGLRLWHPQSRNPTRTSTRLSQAPLQSRTSLSSLQSYNFMNYTLQCCTLLSALQGGMLQGLASDGSGCQFKSIQSIF